MNADNEIQKGGRVHLARKTWLAYIYPSILALILLPAIPALLVSAEFSVALLGSIAIAGFVGYVFSRVATFEVFYDDEGVWLLSGGLPWNTAIRGLRWRELDGAYMSTSLFSWMTGSYRIALRRRFTGEVEVDVNGVHMGKAVVQRINSRHQELIASGKV